jgi:hypothetical protein
MTVTRTPTNTRTPTRTPSPTPTATPTRGGDWPGLLLSEVLYDALEEGADADWEWIEVWNPSGETVSMSGWLIADSAGQDRLPETEIGAGERIIIAARAARFQERYPAYAGALLALEGNIGNGLSNTGDSVKLIAPDGSIIDAMSYGSDKTVFDPACKDVKAGQSLGRLDAADSDTSEDWAAQEEPGPGEPSRIVAPTPTRTATPTPTDTATTPTPTATAATPAPGTATPLPPQAFAVTLNEILPDPATIDWDRDGEANFADEWIELHNASALPVPLAGWTISDEAGAYTLPAGTVIWPRGFLLLYRGQTRLTLSDWRDTVTLMRSDGSLGDRLTYERGPGDDQTFCRLPDGSGGWSGDCQVTPGEANRARPAPPPAPPGSPQPTATPRARAPQTVRASRLAPVDTRVTVTGAVTLPSGLIDKTIYLQDETGGIKIYLRKGEYPPLKVGDEVKATGWTRDFHGEAELSVPDPSYITVVRPGQPPAARFLSAKDVGEEHEGALVQVAGFVVKFAPRGLTLRDKSGQVEIYFPESLPWRRPYVNVGDLWAAQGVASQYQSERGAGYRIIPRFRADVTNGPLGLPVTGSANGLIAPEEERSAE